MKRVIMSSSDLSKLYIVTYRYDRGDAERGPVPETAEDLIYAISEYDACRKRENRYADDVDGYEGCWAREATAEDLDEFDTTFKDIELPLRIPKLD